MSFLQKGGHLTTKACAVEGHIGEGVKTKPQAIAAGSLVAVYVSAALIREEEGMSRAPRQIKLARELRESGAAL